MNSTGGMNPYERGGKAEAVALKDEALIRAYLADLEQVREDNEGSFYTFYTDGMIHALRWVLNEEDKTHEELGVDYSEYGLIRLPCPKCGGEARLDLTGPDSVVVICDDCGNRGLEARRRYPGEDLK